MGVASGCGKQEVGVASGSGWNLWVWLVGVVVRRYIYISSYYLSLLFLYLFLQQHPYFLLIFLMFFVFVPVLFVIKFYVLNYVFVQYKHTYGQLRASHGSYMKAAHITVFSGV